MHILIRRWAFPPHLSLQRQPQRRGPCRRSDRLSLAECLTHLRSEGGETPACVPRQTLARETRACPHRAHSSTFHSVWENRESGHRATRGRRACEVPKSTHLHIFVTDHCSDPSGRVGVWDHKHHVDKFLHLRKGMGRGERSVAAGVWLCEHGGHCDSHSQSSRGASRSCPSSSA